MAITVDYQGTLAENTGMISEIISEEGSLKNILDVLKEKHPSLRELSFVVSVNGIISHHEIQIKEGDNVTLIPPAPGG